MLLYPPALNGNVLLRFPCGRDKRPLTTHGFHDATNVSGILTEWWRRWPTALCGVPTGAVSDFDVLDIDPRNGGDQGFYGNHTRPPRTRTHQTASGGLHLIFQHATGLRCSSGTIAAGNDVRSTGGYVIWWPASGLPVVSDATGSALARLAFECAEKRSRKSREEPRNGCPFVDYRRRDAHFSAFIDS